MGGAGKVVTSGLLEPSGDGEDYPGLTVVEKLDRLPVPGKLVIAVECRLYPDARTPVRK